MEVQGLGGYRSEGEEKTNGFLFNFIFYVLCVQMGRGCSLNWRSWSAVWEGGSVWCECCFNTAKAWVYHKTQIPGISTSQRKGHESSLWWAAGMSPCSKSCTCGNEASLLLTLFLLKATWCHVLIWILVASLASVSGSLGLPSRCWWEFMASTLAVFYGGHIKSSYTHPWIYFKKLYKDFTSRF